MHSPNIKYMAPTTVPHACIAVAQDPANTQVLAGGQSLLPRLIRRQVRPNVLVDITRIAQLQQIYATADELHVGAAVTQRAAELEPATSEFGVLAQALPWVGKVPTRNRGTVVGSLANANPAAEIGVCFVLLNGDVCLASTRGFRTVEAKNFFISPRNTALHQDELIHSVRFRRPPLGTISHFKEVTIRGHGDTPLVSAAVSAVPCNSGAADVSIVIGGEGQCPVKAPVAVTSALMGSISDDAIEFAARSWAGQLSFVGDSRASGDHRTRLATNVVRHLLQRLRENIS